jgi:hypothetical protein
MILAL